ncbi:MAG: DUF2520 domain-containing protein [Nocardioides sp.]|nr:DUF2520 domain-containing protein [Nocardioides sp.]
MRSTTPAPTSLGAPHPCTPLDGLTVGVLGAGRVGAVLGSVLQALPTTAVVAASGETPATRERMADLLPGVEVAKPTAVARACDLLLLTVPDDMLPGVVRSMADSGSLRPGQLVVHTSGKHGLDVLAPAAAVGCRVLAVHPAMTFTGTAADVERLQGCVFGVTVPDELATVADALVAALGGRPVRIAEEHRALYHAGLAHGANHLVTLVSQAMDLLRAAGVDDPAGTLRPLLTAALDNTLEHGDAALTGPVARGDLRTVRDHLSRITEHAPGALDAYAAMARATVERTVADGRLAPRRAVALDQALTDALAGEGGGRVPGRPGTSAPVREFDTSWTTSSPDRHGVGQGGTR